MRAFERLFNHALTTIVEYKYLNQTAVIKVRGDKSFNQPFPSKELVFLSKKYLLTPACAGKSKIFEFRHKFVLYSVKNGNFVIFRIQKELFLTFKNLYKKMLCGQKNINYACVGDQRM